MVINKNERILLFIIVCFLVLSRNSITAQSQINTKILTDQFAVKNNRPDIILKRKMDFSNEALIKHYYQQYKKRLRKIGIYEEKLSSDYHVPLAEIVESKQDGKFLNLIFKLSDNKYNLKRYNIYVMMFQYTVLMEKK